MKQVIRLVGAAVLVAASASSLLAQSLGEVARQEESRRKRVAKPSKVYTNESLKNPDGSSAPAPVPAPSGSASSGGSASSTPPAPETAPSDQVGGKRDQKYWHDRITAARDNLERSKTFEEALQTRINSLKADFVSRDDPAQRSVIGTNLQKALAELDRVKNEIAKSQKEIGAIEEEARRAGAPPGWLR